MNHTSTGTSLRIVASLICAFAFAIPACGSASPEASAKPDILLISIDTTRADFLTFKDENTAPKLAAAAANGTIFNQAVSGSTWTLPAHAQMFTGMAPPYHGSEMERVTVDPALPMLAELLDRAGYQTLGVHSNPYLWGNYGFERGFDYYHSAMLPEYANQDELRFAPRGDAATESFQKLAESGMMAAPTVVRIVRRALERTQKDEPVFLFAHIMEPHADYIPPPPFDTKFDPDYAGTMHGRNFQNNLAVVDYSKNPPRQISDRDLDHIKALYRGEIASADAAIGEILQLFEIHGRLDNTLVIVTADHGESFFEHRRTGHRGLTRDEVLRVPLLVIPPKADRPASKKQSEATATLSDVLPTILDFARIDVPDVVKGTSLRPALEGDEFAERITFFSDYDVKNLPDGSLEHRQSYGLRSKDFKVIRRSFIVGEKTVKEMEIFWDLSEDPREKSPVRDPQDPALRRAIKKLDERLKEAQQHWIDHPRTPREERKVQLDDWYQELQRLGYFVNANDNSEKRRLKPWGLAPRLAQ